MIPLILRNVRFHWRGNLAVLLGVAVGSAVLTGALLVGDSLRGSLRARAERQLDGIDAVALFPRPVRLEVADGMPGRTAPVLLVQGSIQTVTESEADARHLSGVTILGVDDRFKPEGVDQQTIDWNDEGRSIVLGTRVAERLGVKVGDKVKVGAPRFSDLPRASLLAKRSQADVAATFELTVSAILPPSSAANDFNLTPSPSTPLNVFIPIRTLSPRLADTQRSGSRRPAENPVVANALLSSGASVPDLDAALKPRLTLADWGLRVGVAPYLEAYVQVDSSQLVMNNATVDAVEGAAKSLELHAERTMVYLVNGISFGKEEIPYSIVAALNPAAQPPLGPFLPPGVSELKDGDIVLADWPESPLKGLPSDTELTLTFYNPEIEGEGKIETAKLRLRGYIPLFGTDRSALGTTPANDRDLTPQVRGITDDKTNYDSMTPPPPLDNKEIKKKIKSGDRNDRYWQKYRFTPKAYVNLATGERLFGSRYGSATSIRVAPAAGETPLQTSERLKPAILDHMSLAAGGMGFDPIRQRLFSASKGGNDFGILFLGFSMFLIAAALILVGLLFRLNLDRRAKEIGLLLATGYTVRQVRRLIVAEGLVLAIVGSMLGLLAAIGYNRLMLQVLLSLWPDPAVAGFLQPHETATSFLLGAGLTIAMSFGALWLSVRGLVRIPPPALLRGECTVATVGIGGSRYGLIVVIVSVLLGICLLASGRFISNPDFQAMAFFGSGSLLLTAALAAVWIWLKRTRTRTIIGHGFRPLAMLGAHNAARNPMRSLLTTALLASAAFLLVAVESFRRQPDKEFLNQSGGSGGFNLIAETDIPIYQPFDKGPGRIDLEDRLQTAFGGKDDSPRFVAAEANLADITVFPFRLRAGDDASCLNLFKASRPRVLGVPNALISRGGFKFYETEIDTFDARANPWLLLDKPTPNGAIPAFVENNTALYMLKTGVGDDFTMPDDAGNEVKFRIVGTLVDSPFQSELLISDKDFTRTFPKQDGYRVFLIRTPPGKEEDVGRVLELGFRGSGLIATPTRDRVAAYQAVVGAYLSTFQLLGGFGLLLGVGGLAVVVLRGVWERTGEFALLRAVGYRTRAVQFLLLAENVLLLVLGLFSGVLAAAISVLPHIAEGSSVPIWQLASMLGLIALVGLCVTAAATSSILRVPLIPALRRE